MNAIVNFGERAFELKHKHPETELDRVLHEYAWANSGQVLDIVLDNWAVLKQANLLEAAFISAWSTQKWGSSAWTMPFCRAIFGRLDRVALLKLGDPLPSGELFVIYRGVAGVGSRRRVRGYSWTSDEAIARSFANLRQLPNPAVFRATIKREDVLTYIDASGRNEKEFLILPDKLSGVRKIR